MIRESWGYAVEQFSYIDIFATKGIEYVVVIVVLLAFAGVWIYLSGKRRQY
ncbi:MAG: hypothetical protein AB1714_05205 [Acidobacteriota bacterium]